MTKRSYAFLTVLGIAAALFMRPVYAQDVENFYRGKTVTLVVSSSAGGGWRARLRDISRVTFLEIRVSS